MRSMVARFPASLARSGIPVLIGLLWSASPTFAQPPIPVVSVMPVPVSDVAPSAEFIGRVEAVNTVDIRARIEGFIVQRHFEEGRIVQEGQDLFGIEKTSLGIALAAARAQLAGAQATLRDAEGRLQRNLELRRTQTASQAALDEAQSARDMAHSAMLTAETQVRQAELNLGYASINAPITGRIGRAAFSIGSLVRPTSEPLARIVQLDPIRVVFSVSDRAILQFRTEAGDLRQEGNSGRFIPRLRLSSGEFYPDDGAIEFLGNEVDPLTGTLPVWTRFPNPRLILIPGQFVTMVVRPAAMPRRAVVPLGAVEQDREGRFVLLLDDGNRVALRRIRVGAQVDQNWVVEEGLSGGESLIVGGFQNIRPGAVVRPVAAEAGAAPTLPGGSAAGPGPASGSTGR